MNNLLLIISSVVVIALFPASKAVFAANEELVQMAILLDTSSSMDGLIDQAKSQLWKIVNELALAKKNGKNPKLEVALYEYGKSSISAGEGYIKQVLPLTTDLDNVSDALFRLTTNGGDEYCGMVIGKAVKELKWSSSTSYLKIIFIAGNEPFTQGAVDYRKACKNAVSAGIIVNTIFCGNNSEGISTGWKHGAELADGKYISIDQDQKIEHIAAPQDEEIMKLGQELNRTYIAYGREGISKKERQSEQDKNAASMGAGSMVQRSVAKASAQYSNSAWDIVDAEESGAVKIDNLKDEDMPVEMKGMTVSERKAYLNSMSEKRADLQKKISKLNEERRVYVEKQIKKQAADNTLDTAIIKSIRDQAAKKNYRFN